MQVGDSANKSIFYRQLVQALLREGFQLQAGDFSQDGLSAERNELLSTIRKDAELFVPIHPIFDREAIQRRLNTMRTWATVVCFKYVLSQPGIVAVVEADRLADEELINLANHFDKIIVEMLDVTAKMDAGLGSVRLGSTGILLFVFFDSTSASHFVERTRKKCKIWHFFKKTWVLPWVVDVTNKTVSSHRGLPLFMSVVLNRDHLQKDVFQ
jgi:hypothetical protein